VVDRFVDVDAVQLQQELGQADRLPDRGPWCPVARHEAMAYP